MNEPVKNLQTYSGTTLKASASALSLMERENMIIASVFKIWGGFWVCVKLMGFQKRFVGLCKIYYRKFRGREGIRVNGWEAWGNEKEG